MRFAPDLRVSDAEREAAVGVLKRHYAAGRLDATELTARVEAAYAARVESDLARLVADLPSSPPPPPSRRPRRLPLAATMALLALLVVALADAVPAELWAPLLFFGLPLLVMVTFTVLPFALPLLAVLWLVRGMSRAGDRR